MARAARISTIRGLGPDLAEANGDDDTWVGGRPPATEPPSRISLTCLTSVRADDEPPSLPLAIIPREVRMFSGVFELDLEDT